MKITNIKGFKKIDDYVDYKIRLLKESDKSMGALYDLMFSEKENVFFEESDGFRIKKTTYGEVYAEIEEKFSGIKSAVGRENQSKVGVYIKDAKDWIVAFWSLIKAGYCPVLLNPSFSAENTEKILFETDAVAVISDGQEFKVKTILFGKIPVGIEKISEEFGKEFFVLSSGTKAVKICSYSAERVSDIIVNSKYIMQSNARMKEHYNGELKLLTILPFYHIFGFVALYVWFGFYSRTFVKINNLEPRTIQNAIKRHRVTHIFAVPLFWNTVYRQAIDGIKKRGEKVWIKAQKGVKISTALGSFPLGRFFSEKAFKELRDNMFGESVKFMITGGGAISSDALRFFNAVGYHFVNGYGMSEIGITSVELSSKRKVIVSGSIGKPLPTVEYKIQDGVLFAKGTSTADYVIENGEKKKIAGEWYNTCDLSAERNGNYYLLGRADDLIISPTGENLNPVEIEEKLFVDTLNELCLISGGENKLPVLLASVPKTLKLSAAEETLSAIKYKIAKNGLSGQIGNIVLVEGSLLESGDFKINRKAIKTKYAEGKLPLYSLEKRAAEKTDDEITDRIRNYFAVALGKDVKSVGLDTDFFTDEGGTSLDYFALVSKLQEDFSMDFPTVAGESLSTVNEFSKYVKENL